APDELQRLDEELGLADAARTELQVARRIRGDLRAGAADEGHHLDRDPRVHLAAPHERRQRREDLAAEGEIPRDRPRAEEGRALPGAAPRLVVALRCRERV